LRRTGRSSGSVVSFFINNELTYDTRDMTRDSYCQIALHWISRDTIAPLSLSSDVTVVFLGIDRLDGSLFIARPDHLPPSSILFVDRPGCSSWLLSPPYF
jgi:hypothetical protein